MKKPAIDATATGAFAVAVWGSALPIVKLVEDRIGLLAFIGFAYTAMVVFGVVRFILRPEAISLRAIFRNRFFYGRWLFFVLHEGLLNLGIFLVQKRHMPFLILLNYLWPTMVILCSVPLATVSVKRWWALLLGSLIVVCSMGVEVVGPARIQEDLFSRRQDCLAYLLVLIGAVSWGIYSALSRSRGEETGGSAVLPLFQATLGLALPVSLFTSQANWHRLNPSSVALLLGYCLLLFFAYVAWDQGMRLGNIVVLSLLADLIPWLSLITTDFMLRVPLKPRTSVSAAVLVVGAIITRFGTVPGRTVLHER